MKKLLIRADDIGYSEAVTAGILSALESSLVKSSRADGQHAVY